MYNYCTNSSSRHINPLFTSPSPITMYILNKLTCCYKRGLSHSGVPMLVCGGGKQFRSVTLGGKSGFELEPDTEPVGASG
jgi:hypothetical protein